MDLYSLAAYEEARERARDLDSWAFSQWWLQQNILFQITVSELVHDLHGDSVSGSIRGLHERLRALEQERA